MHQCSMMESVGLCPLVNVSLFKTIRFGIFVIEKRYGNCPFADEINTNSTHPRFKLHNSASSSHNDDLDKLSTISYSISNDVDEFGGVLCKPHDCLSFSKKLTDYGCCVLKDVFSRPSLQAAQDTCSKLTANLIKRYDRLADEFNGLEKQSVQESLCITRCPRIGKGKHNVHFDPYESNEHSAIVKLLEEANFLNLLSSHAGKVCTLRESGLSLTKPSVPSQLVMSQGNGSSLSDKILKKEEEGEEEREKEEVKVGDLESGGEGMEWHSDGSKGEFTMLLSFKDIDPNMGSLKVVPGSHLNFAEGIGHGNIEGKDFSKEEVAYAYRAGEPMLIDARTLHAVSRNRTDAWRVVMWCIFDCY